MQAKAFFFFAAFLTIFLLSCGDCSKRIDCPGYKDDTLDTWFPYQNNQQLIFRSNTHQYDTSTLRNTETTAPYQATGGIFSPLYCDARKVFQSDELDTFKRSKLRIELSTGNGSRMVDYSFGKNSFNIYNMQGNGLGQVNTGGRSLIPQRLPTITLGNRTFSNVIEATGDTATLKTPGLYKIYYAKGEGLVGFSEYPSLQTWVKQ